MKFGRRSSLNMDDVEAMVDHDQVAPDGMLRLPVPTGGVGAGGTRRGSIPAVLDGDTIKFASLPSMDAERASMGMAAAIAEEEERDRASLDKSRDGGMSSSFAGSSGGRRPFPRARHGSLPMSLIYAHARSALADVVPQIERDITAIEETNEQEAPEGMCELEQQRADRAKAIERLRMQSQAISKALEDGSYLENEPSNGPNNTTNKRDSVSRDSASRRSSLPTVLEGHRGSSASEMDLARKQSRSRNQMPSSPKQTHAEMMAAAREQIAKEKKAKKKAAAATTALSDIVEV